MPISHSSHQEDLYAALGVSEHASQEAIDAAFREKSVAITQEISEGLPGAEERLRAVTMAHAILGNPATRLAYHKVRKSEQNSRVGAEPAKLLAQASSGGTENAENDRVIAKIAGCAMALAHGKVPASKVLGYGILLPFIVVALVSAFVILPFAVRVIFKAWYVATGFALFQSALLARTRLSRWSIRTLGALVVAWNLVLLLGITIPLPQNSGVLIFLALIVFMFVSIPILLPRLIVRLTANATDRPSSEASTSPLSHNVPVTPPQYLSKGGSTDVPPTTPREAQPEKRGSSSIGLIVFTAAVPALGLGIVMLGIGALAFAAMMSVVAFGYGGFFDFAFATMNIGWKVFAVGIPISVVCGLVAITIKIFE